MTAPNQTGNGPPEMEMGELFRQLTQLPRPSKVVPFPRKDPITKEWIGGVAIWPLTQSELMSARAAADAYAKKLLKDQQKTGEDNRGYEDIYKDAATVEVLCRACRNPKNLKEPAFPSPKLARETLLADEWTVLSRAYLQIQRELGPIVDFMTAEEMNAWLVRLREEGSRFPLALLASEQLEDLVMHSASLAHASLTAKSSSGSPQSGGSNPPIQAADSEAPPTVEFDAPPPEEQVP